MKRIPNPWTLLAALIIIGELAAAGWGITRVFKEADSALVPPVVSTAKLEAARSEFRTTVAALRDRGELTIVDQARVQVAMHLAMVRIGFTPAEAGPACLSHTITDPRVQSLAQEMMSTLTSVEHEVLPKRHEASSEMCDAATQVRRDGGVDIESSSDPSRTAASFLHWLTATALPFWAYSGVLSLLFVVASFLRREDRCVGDLYLRLPRILASTALGPLGVPFHLLRSDVALVNALHARYATAAARNQFSPSLSGDAWRSVLHHDVIASLWRQAEADFNLARFQSVSRALTQLRSVRGLLRGVTNLLADSITRSYRAKLEKIDRPAADALFAALEQQLAIAAVRTSTPPRADEPTASVVGAINELASRIVVPRRAFVIAHAMSWAVGFIGACSSLLLASSATAEEVPQFHLSGLGYAQLLHRSDTDDGFSLLRLRGFASLTRGPLTLFADVDATHGLEVKRLYASVNTGPATVTVGDMLNAFGYSGPPPHKDLTSGEAFAPGGEPGNQRGIELLLAPTPSNGVADTLRLGIYDRDKDLSTADRQLMLRAERTRTSGDDSLTVAANLRVSEGAPNHALQLDGTACRGTVCLNAAAKVTRSSSTSTYGYIAPYVSFLKGKLTAVGMIETNGDWRIGVVTDFLKHLRTRSEVIVRDHGRETIYTLGFQPQFSF